MSDKELTEALNTIEELQNTVVNHLIEWFHNNYEDPVHTQPVESGEFVWLVSKCDAHDELQVNFPEVPEDLIMQAVVEIQSDGTYEWCSIKELDDFPK